MVERFVVFTKKIHLKNPGPKIPSPEELSGALEWRLDGRLSTRFEELDEGTYAIAFNGKGFVGEILARNLIMYGILEFDRSSKIVRVNGILTRKQTVSFFLILLAMIALSFVAGFSTEAMAVLLFVPLYFANIYRIESSHYSKIAEVAAQQWEEQRSLG